MVAPFSLPIRATRFSHSTPSKGDFFPSVKYRGKARPFPVRAAVFSTAASVACEFPLRACFTVAICPSRTSDPASLRGDPAILLPCRGSASLQVWELKRKQLDPEAVKGFQRKKTTAGQSYRKITAKRQ